MKRKFLSAVLSLVLFASLTPVSFAETTTDEPSVSTHIAVSATEATVIELEDYAEQVKYANNETGELAYSSSYTLADCVAGETIIIYSLKAFSGGEGLILRGAEIPEGQTFVTYEIPVTVAEAGWYSTEYHLGGSTYVPSVSNVIFEIVDSDGVSTVIGDKRIPDIKDVPKTTIINHLNGQNSYTIDGKSVKLDAGDYTLKMNVYDATDKAGNTAELAVDYFKFAPAVPVEIGNDKVTIEYEGYDRVLAVDNDKANAGCLLYDSWTYTSMNPHVINLLIDVKETGYYSWESVMSYKTSGGVSSLALKVDGKQLTTNSAKGVDISDTDGDGISDFMGSNYPLNKYSGNKLFLTAGVHEVTLEVGLTGNNVIKFAADYIAFEKTAVATVTKTAETALEIEDFADQVAYANNTDITITNSSSYSGSDSTGTINVLTRADGFVGNKKGLYLNGAEIPAGQTYVTYVMPVTVAEDGWYATQYHVGGNTNFSAVSNVSFEIVDSNGASTYIGDRRYYNYAASSTDTTAMSKSKAKTTNPLSNNIMFTYEGRTLKLSKGDYTIKMNVHAVSSTNNTAKVIIDQFKFTPVTPVKVGTEKVTFEFEDYDKVLSQPNDKASGGYILFDTWINTSANHLIDFIIDVEKTGYYNWETVMNYLKVGGTSRINLKVDGTTIANNKSTGIDISDTDADQTVDFVDSSYPMNKYTGEAILLEKGEHNITLEVERNGSQLKFAADYFAISEADEIPASVARINDTAQTTLEWEKCVEQITYTNSNFGGVQTNPGGEEEVLGVTWGGISSTTTDVNYSIPVYVDKAGWYSTEYVVSSTRASRSNYSNVVFSVGDTIVGDNTPYPESYNEAHDALYTAGFPVYKFIGRTVYLEEGPNTVYLKAYDCTAAQAVVKFSADYIKFTPCTPITVGSDKVTVEYENYANTHVSANTGASGGKMLRTNWLYSALKDLVINIPVTVESEGFYDWETVMTKKKGGTSAITLTLDGEVIAKNYDNPSVDVSKNSTYLSNDFPMHKYSGGLYLEAGEHIVTMTVKNYERHSSGDYVMKYAADYFSIEKSNKNNIIAEDNNIVLSASYETPASGTAYAAFYYDGKLVKVDSKAVSNASDIMFEYTDLLISDFDEANIFVWDANQAPVGAKANYSVLPVNTDPFADDEEINVVFLGDSIYEAWAVTEERKFINQVGQWFKDKYEDENTTVNYYNKGVGGTTTEYSLARLASDVISYNPDVVFVAATINDGSRDTASYMESIVKTLRDLDNAPYIVFTVTPNVNGRLQAEAGRLVADYYDLALMDFADAFDAATADGKEMSSLFPDGTHPNDEGHDIIANEMIKLLSTNRYLQKASARTDSLYPDSKVIDVASCDRFAVTDARVTKTGAWTESGTEALITTEADSTLEFEFTGNILAFEYGLMKNGGVLEVYVDDNLELECNCEYYDVVSHQLVCKEGSAVFDLEDGTHKVRMVVVPEEGQTTVNYKVSEIFTGSWK